MQTINFTLTKNNNEIISKQNIKAINNKSKITFVINKEKYEYNNRILIKENNTEKITLDFNKNMCTILLKEGDYILNCKIDSIIDEKNKNIVIINYKIETEEDVLNTIKLEYI